MPYFGSNSYANSNEINMTIVFVFFFQGFFICAIETFGTCIFVMKIPSLTQPYMVILLSNCVFIVPVGVALYKAMFKTSTQSTNESDNTTQSTNESNNTTQSTNESNSTTKSTKKSYITRPIFFGISFLLELTGIGLTVTLWIWSKHSTDLENIWYPIVGTLCLSIAWVPEIQSFLLQHATEEEARYTPTWKMVIYMSFIKIVLTFVFSFTLLRFAIFDSSVDATAVIEHFKSGWYGWEGFETYYFIANGCSSLLGYVIGFIACTTCMQKGAYAMPLFLATPLAAVLFSAYESCVRILHPGDTSNMCLLEGRTDVWLLVGACSCLVFAQFFSFGYLIIISRPLIKQDEAQVRLKQEKT